MKKSELVTLVAEKTGFSKKDTEKTIDTVFTAIADIMAAGFVSGEDRRCDRDRIRSAHDEGGSAEYRGAYAQGRCVRAV